MDFLEGFGGVHKGIGCRVSAPTPPGSTIHPASLQSMGMVLHDLEEMTENTTKNRLPIYRPLYI